MTRTIRNSETSSDGDRHGITVLMVTADSEFATGCRPVLSEHMEAEVTIATTVGEAVDTLSQHPIDCVVSDQDLPDTDGVAFLEIVRAQFPALPFILFTSDGGEELASRAISAGVTECLSKEHHSDQWNRLAQLITDAVTYYRDHGDIVATDRHAQTLLDAARDMIAVARDGEIEYVNQTGVDLLRATARSDVVGRSVEQILSTGENESLADRLAVVETGEHTHVTTERQLVRDDNTVLPVEVTATHITWMDAPAVALVIRDISERKGFEAGLDLQERAMDEAPVGITIADATQPDNPLIYANEQFQRLTGYSPAEVLGRNCRFLQGEETDRDSVRQIREAIDAGESVTVELQNYRKEGTKFWNRVTIAPVENDAGDVTHFVGFQEDVTERKEDEHELRRFRRAVEAAGHAIYVTDTDGTIEYVNPAFEEITGYDSDDAVGETPHILHSGVMSDDYYEDLWTTISDGEVWEEEIRDQRKSGDVYHASQTIAPVVSDGGTVEEFVAVQTDISDQKERETQLRQYERAIEGAKELVAAVDDEYQYLFANPAYCDFHDIAPGDVVETTVPAAVDTDVFETIAPCLEQALAGETIRDRITHSRPDKPDRTFDSRYHPLVDDTGAVQGVVMMLYDITEQLEREEQLAALDRLLRHNLRNELNVILGRAETIETTAPDDIARQATIIEGAAQRLLEQAEKEREVVKLLTDVSSPKTIDLESIVDEIGDRIETTYPDTTITVETTGNIQLTTVPEIERAIEEIVENAVIHTDHEAPAVEVNVTGTDRAVEITVTDTGPGLPPNVQKVIADDASIEPLSHSEGMGLWLVKRIVTRAGGTLSFDANPDHESSVTLVVPRHDETSG